MNIKVYVVRCNNEFIIILSSIQGQLGSSGLKGSTGPSGRPGVPGRRGGTGPTGASGPKVR